MTYLTTQAFRKGEASKFQPVPRKRSVPFWAIATAVSIVSFAVTFNILS